MFNISVITNFYSGEICLQTHGRKSGNKSYSRNGIYT